MMDTKRCGQLTSNENYFSGIWLCEVKTDEGGVAEGVDCCVAVKTVHKGFCLDTLENLMKDYPGGLYIVINSNPRIPGGIPLMYVLQIACVTYRFLLHTDIGH